MVEIWFVCLPTSPMASPARFTVATMELIPSVLRSMELIMGMKALSLNDALATPMYDVFTSRPLNTAPFDAIPAKVDLLTRNTQAAPWAALSNSLPLGEVDTVPQGQLNAILWKSVHGASSTPPPAGPNAEEDQ